MKQTLKNATIWTGWAYFFGLLQIILLYVASLVCPIKFPIIEILKDGSLLFFVTAMVATLMLDYLFLEKKLARWINASIISIALVLILFSVFLYGVFLNTDVQNIKTEIIRPLEYAILCTTALYSLSIKAIIFSTEKAK
jgi:hypothetical protein